MRRMLFVAGLLMLISLSTRAQGEAPRVEVFGGYSNAGGNFHGWQAAVRDTLKACVKL